MLGRSASVSVARPKRSTPTTASSCLAAEAASDRTEAGGGSITTLLNGAGTEAQLVQQPTE